MTTLITAAKETTAGKERDVYLFLRFIAAASGGYKTDFNLNNIISTLSFYFFREIFASKCVG